LLKRTDTAPGWAPADDGDRLHQPGYDLRSLSRQRGFLQALQQALEASGLDVLQLGHEDAHGQFEVNFGFDEVLASADHLMLFKQAAHALAEERGMVLSMMPKPFADQPGSGMHMHVSLWQEPGKPRALTAGQGLGLRFNDNARNAFVPHKADGSVDAGGLLSTLGEQFAAGVLAHSAGLAALAAPTVNSYKRLVVGALLPGTGWAPAVVAQGPNNRTALLRTLHGRFEWRLPDASANPYLASAALIAAGLDGVDRALALPEAQHDDLSALAPAALAERGLATLPQDLGQALDALAADAVLTGALGATLSQQFNTAKRDECLAHARHVSSWELDRYAAAF